MYKYNTKILDNGLKIIAHKMPQMESIALGIWIATGGRYENKKRRGISHFIEHLLFKGTKKRTAAQIKNSIEGIGGILNAFTSEEATCYLIKVLGRHLRLGLDVLGDMVLNAKFAREDIERERSVILEEIKMYRDQPDQYVNELLGELMWPGEILGIPLVGTFQSVNSLKKKDMIECRDKSYNPSNITIVACGNVDWDTLVEECDRIFSKKKKGRIYDYKKMRVSQKAAKVRINNKNTEQTHIAIGFHGISRKDSARYAMDLMNIVLGANMSSRLFHELREKRGLAYAIGSHVSYFADGGAAVIEAGVDNKKLTKAIELTLKELSKLKCNPITKKEFDRAREYYQGILSFVLEDTVSHMLWLGKKLVTGDEPIDINKILNRIREVTMDDILKISGDIFRKDKLNIAVIGPIGDKEKKTIKEMAGEL
jgi:predicted Zn-dependent peptidase